MKALTFMSCIVLAGVVLFSAIGDRIGWSNTCYSENFHTKNLMFNGVTLYSTFESHKDNPLHK
ncbi:hypothetical protein IODZLFCR_CDS0013 [Salmonella phage vB_SalP_SE29]|uniref:Uncharacterized protein n=2 Tax=Molineuxvirinae TaxID=2731650 RepID=A0A977TFS3_9CAUD|nr:hypothetical protein [Salmonella phage PST_H2]